MVMPTGLYKVSIQNRLKQARADVTKCEKSLNGLRNQASDYAQEHRNLLAVLKSVEQIYVNACEKLA